MTVIIGNKVYKQNEATTTANISPYIAETRVGKLGLKMSSGKIRHFKSVKKLKNFEKVAQAYKHGWSGPSIKKKGRTK